MYYINRWVQAACTLASVDSWLKCRFAILAHGPRSRTRHSSSHQQFSKIQAICEPKPQRFMEQSFQNSESSGNFPGDMSSNSGLFGQLHKALFKAHWAWIVVLPTALMTFKAIRWPKPVLVSHSALLKETIFISRPSKYPLKMGTTPLFDHFERYFEGLGRVYIGIEFSKVGLSLAASESHPPERRQWPRAIPPEFSLVRSFEVRIFFIFKQNFPASSVKAFRPCARVAVPVKTTTDIVTTVAAAGGRGLRTSGYLKICCFFKLWTYRLILIPSHSILITLKHLRLLYFLTCENYQ